MRKKEFMKKSEARIIIYLNNVTNQYKTGRYISERLQIDYIYIMKLLRGMYDKGWSKVHQYQERSYFENTNDCPIKEAKDTLNNVQHKIYSKVRQ